VILDNNLVLSGAISALGVVTGQAANGAGNVLGTNTIDLAPLTIGGNQAGDTGAGEPLEVEFSILTAPTVGTSVTFQLIQADDAALSSNVQVISATDAYPIASLPAGTLVPLHWDRTAPYAPKRYFGVRYVNAGAIATFSVFAAVVKNLQDAKNIFYKSGYAVS
jgi:hypothetical protein